MNMNDRAARFNRESACRRPRPGYCAAARVWAISSGVNWNPTQTV